MEEKIVDMPKVSRTIKSKYEHEEWEDGKEIISKYFHIWAVAMVFAGAMLGMVASVIFNGLVSW